MRRCTFIDHQQDCQLTGGAPLADWLPRPPPCEREDGTVLILGLRLSLVRSSRTGRGEHGDLRTWLGANRSSTALSGLWTDRCGAARSQFLASTDARVGLNLPKQRTARGTASYTSPLMLSGSYRDETHRDIQVPPLNRDSYQSIRQGGRPPRAGLSPNDRPQAPGPPPDRPAGPPGPTP
jgi:hypothetical protein